jgi:hypothetical protein
MRNQHVAPHSPDRVIAVAVLVALAVLIAKYFGRLTDFRSRRDLASRDREHLSALIDRPEKTSP